MEDMVLRQLVASVRHLMDDIPKFAITRTTASMEPIVMSRRMRILEKPALLVRFRDRQGKGVVMPFTASLICHFRPVLVLLYQCPR